MRIPRIGTLVAVEWDDSSSIDRWCPLKEALDALDFAKLCKTVGWIAEIKKDCIKMVCCAAFDKSMAIELSSSAYRIPLVAIKRITRLGTHK